ncbi:MAG: hypothetical protein ACREVG_14160, partial [Burkholderiales bacterium]
LIVAALLALICGAPAQAGRIVGHFSDGVYRNPQKVFNVRSPFPGELTILAGVHPDNSGADAADWNQFLPQLVDQYQRIDFLKQ